MDFSVKSEVRLDVSVSFGKFENDGLSLEKWSSFSPNKYLEEIGSLSTPGSVAQKKAYFEAHYKKIAAKKAEELEQEGNNMPTTYPNSPGKAYSVECSSMADGNLDSLSNGQRLTEVIAEDTPDVGNNNAVESNGQRSVEESLPISELVEDNSFEGVDQRVNINEEKAIVESVEQSQHQNRADTVLENREGAECSVSETRKISKKVVSKNPERKKDSTVKERSNALNKEKTKSKSPNSAQKVMPVKEKDAAAAKRKVIAPSAKSLQASNLRQAKPTMSSTSLSSSQPLKKKTYTSQLQKSMGGKIAPTSLHMSISLGPTNSPSSSSVPMTRKSLIMERMGDKDIVKRAFKAFQNPSDGSSSANEKRGPSSASETKVASAHSHGKPNEGLRKDAKKPITPKSAPSIRSTPLPSSRKSVSSISPANGLMSSERTEKRQEFLKKLEARSISRTAENARTHAKSKEDKALGMKRLTQSLNMNGKSMQSFNEDKGKRR